MIARKSLSVLVLLLSVAYIGCVVPKAPSLDSLVEGRKLIDKGTILMRKGDLDRAEATFGVAYESSRLPAALDGIGCVAVLKHDFPTAERIFLRVLREHPEYPTVRGNLALLYRLWDRSEESREQYRIAIGADPRNFRIRNNYAALLSDYFKSPQGHVVMRRELLSASAVAEHPVVMRNLERIE